jgi:hypothetical protein
MMDDDDDDDNFCDWCSKETKRRSLIMGTGFAPKWGKGEVVCAKCLNTKKSFLYKIKYKGRTGQMFATKTYYNKYWKNGERAKVLQEPIANNDDDDGDDDDTDTDNDDSVVRKHNNDIKSTTATNSASNRGKRKADSIEENA